jgi:TrmH family RNA methyltransferase
MPEAKRITSRDNPRYKAIARLCHSARDRKSEGRSIMEGLHLAQAYAQRFGPPEWVVVDENALSDKEIAAYFKTQPEASRIVLTTALFAELSQLASPGGLIAVVPTPAPKPQGPCRFALLLEDIQDPGNLGTMLRAAAAAGVERVYLSPKCAFAWSQKTLRAGQGAHFHLEIVEQADLVKCARDFQGRVVATDPRAAASLFDARLAGPVAFVVGNEGAGVSEALLAASGERVAIPMPGGFESLNAAMAAAICLFEKVRQETAGKSPSPPTAPGAGRSPAA